MHRYDTQARTLGQEGQTALLQAHVIVVGAGGLGCALLPWLAGAGIGTLHVMDDDNVALTNLHRQPLYTMQDIGHSKVECASRFLQALNPDIQCKPHHYAAQSDTIATLIQPETIVIDAADNVATTYMLSDVCHEYHRPLVSGSVIGWEGYAGVFCGDGPSYRAVFPEPFHETMMQNCGESGVFPPAVALIGSIMAHFCMALILPHQESPIGELRRWDARQRHMRAIDFRHAPEPQNNHWPFLAWSEIEDDDIVIDVRLLDERPSLPRKNVIHNPLNDFPDRLDDIPRDKRVVLCCQTGARAAKAAKILREKGYQHLALMAVSKQHI